MVFHRCVIAVIGVLAVSTSAAAGPIKLSDAGPPLDVSELRANGALGKAEIRALFFRGGTLRNPAAGCGDCLAAESSLSARDRNGNGPYKVQFPFSSGNLFKSPIAVPSVATAPSYKPVSGRPDLLTGASTEAVVEGGAVAGPVSSSAAVSPQALAAAATVPEPGTIALFGSGLVGGWLLRRSRRQ